MKKVVERDEMTAAPMSGAGGSTPSSQRRLRRHEALVRSRAVKATKKMIRAEDLKNIERKMIEVDTAVQVMRAGAVKMEMFESGEGAWIVGALNSRKKTEPGVTLAELHQEKDATIEDLRIELIIVERNAKRGHKARSAAVIMAEHFGIPQKTVDDSRVLQKRLMRNAHELVSMYRRVSKMSVEHQELQRELHELNWMVITVGNEIESMVDRLAKEQYVKRRQQQREVVRVCNANVEGLTRRTVYKRRQRHLVCRRPLCGWKRAKGGISRSIPAPATA